MDSFKLKKAIKIDGNEVTELTYDFEEMSAQDKINASKNMRTVGIPPTVEEIDSSYHLFLFAEAVKKANPSIEYTEILRISARDSQKASSMARSFFYLNSED